jgi:hypothetical protein
MKKLLIGLTLSVWALFPQFAEAQSQRNPCYYPAANSTSCIPVSTDNPLPVTGGGGGGGNTKLQPNSTVTSANAIAPTTNSTAANNVVLKAAPGNVYSAAATNLTSTQGYLVLINATAAPADGTITPKACTLLPANGSASISYGDIPALYDTGVVAVVTSAASCFTKTTGVITAHITGQVP